MYSSLLLWLQTIHTPQEYLCTVLSYYYYSKYILPRNIYVQLFVIMTTDNTVHTPQEHLCTVLSHYDYRQYILPRNVYVQFSLIMTTANTYSPVKFMYSSLLLWLQTIHTPQECLCTVLSYYDYRQYILPGKVYVQFSLITIKANTSFPVTFMYSSLLLWLQTIHPSQKRLCTVLSYFDYRQYILPSNV
jgi:hypothetical protein